MIALSIVGIACVTKVVHPFNWKEDALESLIILILLITFALESDEKFSVNGHELSTHVPNLNVRNFEIL